MSKRDRIAVVVPVYGNELSLRSLYERILKSTQDQNVELTIQFVNDRSPDNSQAVLEDLAREDPRVRVLLLSKNHGSFVAIVAGLNEVKDRDAVIIMAADLQDPPEAIPEMLEAWRQGKPVVLCVRRRRKDSLLTKAFSYLFHEVFRKIAMPEMPAGGFDFCLIDRRVTHVLTGSAEKNTSLVGMIIWAGFDRAYISYDRAKRLHGKSKWSFRRKVRYALNSIISFSSFPLKLIGMMGVILGLVCLAGAVYALVINLTGIVDVPGWTSLMFIILLLGAFQLIGLGILGEYFWNNLEQTRKRPLFIVDRRMGGAAEHGSDQSDGGGLLHFFDSRTVSLEIKGTLDESCRRVLRGERLILGSAVERFERELAAYLGVDDVVGVGNGTDAITLSLMAAGVQPGDGVITSALSAPATAVAIIRAGARPIFVDVEPEHLTIDPDAVQRSLEHNPKAIVPVHLYGNPCDLEALLAVARQHGLTVVEDCAQSTGTTIDGRQCGSFAPLAAFSFYPTKNLGGYGDGGAIAASDAELAELLRRMRFYGQNAQGECVEPGLNSRLDELQAALLLDRLQVLDQQNQERRRIACRYDEALAFLHVVPSREGRAPHLYVVRTMDRQGFRAHLLAKGIQTGVHYPLALSGHAFLKAQGVDTGCPVAAEACKQVVSLPCYPGMDHARIDRVIEACRSWKEPAK